MQRSFRRRIVHDYSKRTPIYASLKESASSSAEFFRYLLSRAIRRIASAYGLKCLKPPSSAFTPFGNLMTNSRSHRLQQTLLTRFRLLPTHSAMKPSYVSQVQPLGQMYSSRRATTLFTWSKPAELMFTESPNTPLSSRRTGSNMALNPVASLSGRCAIKPRSAG